MTSRTCDTLEGSLRVYQQVKEDIAELGSAGARIKDTLTKLTTGAADEGDLQVLGKELVGLTPEQRQKIYRYVGIAAQQDKAGMGAIEQDARNLGQSLSRRLRIRWRDLASWARTRRSANAYEPLGFRSSAGAGITPEKREIATPTLAKSPPPVAYRSNRDKGRDVEAALRADPAKSNREMPVRLEQLTRLLRRGGENWKT